MGLAFASKLIFEVCQISVNYASGSADFIGNIQALHQMKKLTKDVGFAEMKYVLVALFTKVFTQRLRSDPENDMSLNTPVFPSQSVTFSRVIFSLFISWKWNSSITPCAPVYFCCFLPPFSAVQHQSSSSLFPDPLCQCTWILVTQH